MRYPDFLPEGGRIGLIAPSFGCSTEPYRSCFEMAQKYFAEMGYSCVKGPNCYEEKGVGKSNTPRACADEINDFFINDRSDIIISCGGGETMCEDLPYVDFEKIAAAKPKWYMGYSDNTNLVFTLPVLADTAAVYGPCAPAYGTEKPHRSLEDAFEFLKGTRLIVHNYDGWEKESLKTEETPFVPYNITEPFSMTTANVGKEGVSFSGRFLGGCLDCLSILCGTKFDKVCDFNERYMEDGVIWFIESCDLNPMGIRRSLWQLRQAGWFDNARGFLIGRALHYDEDMMGADRINAVTEILGDMGLPILMDIDLGHLPPMMPIVAGAMGHVTAGSNEIAIQTELI